MIKETLNDGINSFAKGIQNHVTSLDKNNVMISNMIDNINENYFSNHFKVKIPPCDKLMFILFMNQNLKYNFYPVINEEIYDLKYNDALDYIKKDGIYNLEINLVNQDI
jgi:hypothetical protein